MTKIEGKNNWHEKKGSFGPPKNDKFQGNIIGMKRKIKFDPPKLDKFERNIIWHERKIILILQNWQNLKGTYLA